MYNIESEKRLPPTEKAKKVDHYWNEVFQIKTNSGTLKYTKLFTLIKAIMVFQNANASAEGSLSDIKILSEQKELCYRKKQLLRCIE